MNMHPFEEMAQALDDAAFARPDRCPDDFDAVSVFPAVTPPGMAYVPYQQWGDVYEPEKGFCKGTMFPVLFMPFNPNGGAR